MLAGCEGVRFQRFQAILHRRHELLPQVPLQVGKPRKPQRLRRPRDCRFADTHRDSQLRRGDHGAIAGVRQQVIDRASLAN